MEKADVAAHRMWIGPAYRLVPHGADILDFSQASRSANNRWNAAGSPTLYLAEDVDIAWNEYTRHARERWSSNVPRRITARDMYRLELHLHGGVVDLCDPTVSASYGVSDMWNPAVFGSLETTRGLAKHIRRTTTAQGLLVPPAGFLDQRVGWNLVVFLEKMANVEDWVRAVTLIHSFDMGAGRF